jgi:membrane protease YdiL (CAAX protease family)
MLVVWRWTPGAPHSLRWGAWDRQTSIVGSGRSTWRRLLAGWLVLVAVPTALIMQAQVGFRPVLTGAVWPMLAPLAALALLNGFLEELLFRGLLQASLVVALGPVRNDGKST